MAINIKFDLVGNPELPTIILATRNGDKLGQLDVNADSIDLSDKFNDASEFSFTLNKYVDGEITNLWDKVVDFKLVYCKEWDMWFEIKVELDEETESVKTVFCTQLWQAELSQLMLYNIEINTEKDIDRDDYKITILYDNANKEASLIHRLMRDKAPHYSIIHCDASVAGIQRTFTFDKVSICDAFSEIAEEIGCLFVYHSGSDENGFPRREISIYDLEQNCMNTDCAYRGEFTDTCPKCGGTNIKYGYGDDTTIFVTSDELAADGIQFVTDVDAVKNCFKLVAGDDLMTATIRNCNPNGTDYIWYFSEDMKADMSNALQERLTSYDEEYKKYYNTYESQLDTTLVSKYNNLVTKYNNLIDKYDIRDDKLNSIDTTIKGYANLMNTYYDVVDFSLFLTSSLMPKVKAKKTNAEEQAKLLSTSGFNYIAVSNADNLSEETANSTALSMAKTYVKSSYKVSINSSELSNGKWKGSFIVTDYHNDEDTYTSSVIELTVKDDEESYIRQKIDKALSKENTDDVSVTGLFKKSLSEFKTELTKYSLKRLSSFRDACQACIDILIEQGVGDNTTEEGKALYDELYLPYYNKLQAVDSEMKTRESEIKIISGSYDANGNLVSGGLKQHIEKIKEQIQKALDFKGYLGDELWLEFCSFRREDEYSNENYISDGLNNAELFKRASEFIDVAEKEIYKSAELQHSISTTLKNLLAIEKFKPLVEHFKLGNWIRVRVDDNVYKLRLLEYNIDFGDFENIKVEFSDITKIKNGFTDLEDILDQSSSMATSYPSTQKQASQGNDAQGTIRQWIDSGLNSALVQIQNNDSEEITFDKNGLLARSYNEFTDSYLDEQLKITHNLIAYTGDNWKTVKQAIGKHNYVAYDYDSDDWLTEVGYGMTAEFVTAGQIMGSKIVGGEIYSSNYCRGASGNKSGTYINLNTGDFSFGGDKIVFDKDDDELILQNVTIKWSSGDGDGGVNTPDITVENITGMEEYLDRLDQLEDQLDGRAQTWYQSTDPSKEWTTDDDKKLHEGDLWHYTGETAIVNGVERTKDSEWVWEKKDGVYQWVAIEISDEVFDAIDGKAQIFTTTPEPPYNVGDLWVQGKTGDILHCTYERVEGESYNSSDWVKSSKYTDDSALETFINGEYADELDIINTQIDKKAESWYQSDDPSTNWSSADKEKHVGDLWFNTSDGKNYVYKSYSDGYRWEVFEGDVPQDIYDTLDGKANVFVGSPYDDPPYYPPVPYNEGDLWVQGANGDILHCVRSNTEEYNSSDWELSSKYNEEINSIVTGIQATEINGEYVISPHIVGGDLEIKSSDGSTSASISTDGFLKATGAEISGTITASNIVGESSLFIGDINSTYAEITSDGVLSCNGAYISGDIVGSSFTGGYIKSSNYTEDSDGICINGTYIDLDNGDLVVGGGNLIYSGGQLSLGKKELSSIISLCDGLGSIGYNIEEVNGMQCDTLSFESKYINIVADREGAHGGIRLQANWYNNADGSNISKQYLNIGYGNTVSLYTSNEDSSAGISMFSSGISEVVVSGDNAYIQGSYNVSLSNAYNSINFVTFDDSQNRYNAFFRPADNKITLGTAGYKWYAVYATNATIQTSDAREKKNIVPFGANHIMTLSLDDEPVEQIDIHSELFDRLLPVQYNYIEDESRTCYGLIAQQVIEAMDELGIEENELDLVHHEYWTDDKTEEEKDSYGIAYANLIPMLIYEVQKLKKQINDN